MGTENFEWLISDVNKPAEEKAKAFRILWCPVVNRFQHFIKS